MSDEDFYEEDEDPRKIEAIWNRPGKKGRTVKRPRDLNQRAASIVGQVVASNERNARDEA
jgi:hypothetical protein